MSAPPPASTPRLDLLRFLERVQERDLQRTRDWIATEEQLISAQGELKQWRGLATRYDKTGRGADLPRRQRGQLAGVRIGRPARQHAPRHVPEGG
ncbi:hypothetical protein AB0C86_36100 [Streptomyces lavendulae]|uniref:hypothetical protein n=1 Tax=Streptomyces lavendulae TaxID=1914 RepID=UPI0033E179D9